MSRSAETFRSGRPTRARRDRLELAVAGSLPGKAVEFGGDVSSIGGADPQENHQRLSQSGFSLGGATGGQGVSLIPGECDGAGQV